MSSLRTVVLGALFVVAAACGPEMSTEGLSLDALTDGLTPAPASVAGQNVTCRNLSLGAISVANVIVPGGATCQLIGTRVTGSIQAGAGAVVDARDITLDGNLQADAAAASRLTGTSRVGGSIQLVGGSEAAIKGATIAGDVLIDSLTGTVTLEASQVGGNVQLKDNLGAVSLSGNRIKGNLQCESNTSAPSVVDTTAASPEGQCAPGTTSPVPGPTNPPAQPPSGNVTCSGLTLGAFALDTVTVPAGASCTLEGTRLIGSLEIGAGATVSADGVSINGNVVAEGAASLRLTGSSRIGGSVQVKSGQAVALIGAAVTGDVQIEAMSGPIVVSSMQVSGNMQMVGNSGTAALNANGIRGALQCKENSPAPTGSGNRAAIKEGQCQVL